MKKYHILFLLALVFFCSCDKFLDVNPDNRADLDSKEKIAGMLVSAYPYNTYCYVAEMSSDNTDRWDRNIQYDNRMQEEFFYWKNSTETTRDSPHNIWRTTYSAIAAANHVLVAIEELGNADGSLDPQIGEALLCRAYGHFVLVNLFCMHYGINSDSDMGIPYADFPETTVSPNYQRGTVAQVYEKIEADIEKGLPLIKDEEYPNPKYRFNKKAAHAFAARFFLFYRKYDKAIAHATEVLGIDPLNTLRDWDDIGSTTDHTIRGNRYVDSDNRANLLLIACNSIWGRTNRGGTYTGGYYVHNSQISSQETDQSTGPWGASTTVLRFRPSSWSGTTGKIASGKIMEYFQYTDQIAGTGYPHIIHAVFTTDETLLCRAEAYVLKGDYDNAVSDLALFMQNYSTGTKLTRENINNFYQTPVDENSPGIYYHEYRQDEETGEDMFFPSPKKRLHPDFTIASDEQENFIHCVLHIRRILTVSEGSRWFDVKRYGIEIYRRAYNAENKFDILDFLPYNDPRRAIQLPMDVINAGLPANPRKTD